MNFTSSARGFLTALLCSAAVPVVAADRYRAALEACQQAASSSDDPTGFKCDWKTVLKGAPGSSLSGQYTYREKGFSGEMTILDPVDEPAQIGIFTVAKNQNGSTCSGGFGASRGENDDLVATMDDPENCEIHIVSVPGPAILKVTASEACNAFCGVSATFAGEWQLIDK